ncbi:hypothetical protein JOQ06_029734 [Pogonophryne albipinna]|uniref:Bromodomain adjacent to zinc finger domain 2B n=1 Tax=Pogonophryne albipinna TaxID=1090488 RepID=A0AAD6AXG9_9TELE|nr:hypothetical protein JOQ06_029734 [Pogonophryne albipinna]
MEFGERLASPSSALSSLHMASSSASSSPAPPQTPSTKFSPAPSPAGSSPLTSCGNLLRVAGEERLSMSGSSNGFPLVSHPAFGLFASSSGRSEFGGLGSLGLSALAAHSQFGAFPDWWRHSETQTIGPAAFFPPLLGLHPVFASAFKSHNQILLQSRTSGVNGAVNGRSASSPSENSAGNTSSLPTKGNSGKTKANNSRIQKSSQELGQLQQKITLKTKDKKPNKRPLESSSMSGSQSGSLSDCSSSDEKYIQVERKVKRLTQNISEGKKKRPHSADGDPTGDRHGDTVPLTSPYHLQSSLHPAGLSQSAALFLHSSRTAEEEGQQHISVIQATGLAGGNGPLAPSHREASPLPSRPPTLLSSKPRHKPRFLMPFLNHAQLLDGTKESSANVPDERLLQSFKLKTSKDSIRQALSLQPKSQNSYKRLKSSASSSLTQHKHSSDTLSSHLMSLPHINDTNLFLSHHLNGMIHGAVQDAPLALITKPRSQSSTPCSKPPLVATSPPCPMPINLSTGSSDSTPKSSASPGGVHRQRKSNTPKFLPGKSLSKSSTSCPPADLVRGSDSLSESESNLDSDSEDDVKERGETEADSDAERTPVKLTKATLSTHKSSSKLSANGKLLNLKIIKPPSLPSSLLTSTSSGALSNHGTPSPSYTFPTLPGSGKRRRVTDERVLRMPLEFGWQRETRIRTVAGRLQGEVAYFAPCGKKLRQYPDIMKYLLRNGITEISRDNFSFSTKIKVGDFYEAREGQEGLQWFLLAEEEVAPSIIAMDGRRSRCPQSERWSLGDGPAARQWKPYPLNVGENNFQDVSDTKLLRKLEAQEIARQAAQIKMMRKLEKQAMAQAVKEARRQQAIMAAEERRKKREQMKLVKQQEKIKRIQQIRMEKEVRAQQIVEAKRKRKEQAVNAKMMEAERRTKDKEIRRMQAVFLKHQELERHRLDMERERRRQHMMLMKAVDARKKAEEKERLKKEKKDEKLLNKERKRRLRRLEVEKAKELKKPNEDLCLADHEPLPKLSRIPGLVLPGSTFSDCLLVLQFLCSFGKVLRLDLNPNMLNLNDLQKGLLNTGDSLGKVQDLLVSMLSAAVSDPGIPAGHKNKTALGENLTNVGINRDNVSEILHIYMEAHCEQTQLAALALSLRTKAFQAHSPSQKASMLAFLVNELCCSKAVISEIDKNIDHMTNLRKDKWAVEGKLRKLRSIHAKKSGKKDSVGGEDSHTSDDSVQSASMEELEKQIEKTYKQQSQIRQKLFDSSHLLRSMTIGQDRYKRRYWVLPQCSGLFVEGMESGEGSEEEEQEEKQLRTAQTARVKEEEQEETKSPAQSRECETPTKESQQDSLNLFLQKPGSFSKLSKFLEVAKMAQDSDINSHNAAACFSASAGINNVSVLQSGLHQSRQCNVSTAASPILPSSGSSLPLLLDLSSQHAEGNGNRVFSLANTSSVNKSETPEPLSDRPECASSPAEEVAKPQDYPRPQPVPEEMLCGWWRVADMEELQSLVKALHSRGIREKALQKQIQKHIEYRTQLCANSKDAIDVEGLERRVVSASLQVKCWMHPERQSDREDLVYHEHKLLSSPAAERKGQRESSQEELPGSVVRRPDNPLDIAVIRLAELERNIERSREEEVAPGMRLWRKALGEVRSSAQLSLCVQQLQKSISWERSIMKVHCQLCHKGDNEELLLLCDGCDKGCHTYCQKPKITTVPDGDWFCPTCVEKESGLSPRGRRQQSRTAGGGKKGSEVKRNGKPSVVGELIKEEAAGSNSVPKKGTKEFKKRRGDDSPPGSQARHDSPVPCVKKAKTAKDSNTHGLTKCRVLLAELEAHQDAWPFLTPVNQKAVPGYRKVIKKPMDLSTIREKLTNNQYLNLETFIADVNLIFDNCEKFNEDDSEIGRAGHSMRRFFDKRWTELLD